MLYSYYLAKITYIFHFAYFCALFYSFTNESRYFKKRRTHF